MFHLHAESSSGWPPADLLHLPSHAPPPTVRRLDDVELAPPRPPPPAGHLFRGTISKRLGRRAARRGAFASVATALECAVLAVVLTIPLVTPAPEQPTVQVRLVRSAAPPPMAPPPPPPAAVAARPRPAAPRPAAAPRPVTALVQPRELPTELAPAKPAPEPEDFAEAGDPDGVVGGVVGGAAALVAAAPPPPRPAPPPPPRPAAPVKFDDRMVAPALVQAPPIEYTQQALEREIQGDVQVSCVVDLEGRVRGCRVLRGLPFLDRSVVENLQARRYRPATLGGEPLEVEYVFTVRFRLPE